MPANTKAPHHRGGHQVRARQLTAAAYANPDTRCGFCNLTHAEYATIHGERAARWVADHYPPGNLDGRYRPAHHRCNSSAGATYGNQRRTRNRTSRNW